MLWLKDTAEIERRLRRICNITTLRGVTDKVELRVRNRLALAIPAYVCPVENRSPVPDQAIFAVAKDISDDGFGLISPCLVSAKDVILGLWLGPEQSPEPWFFRAKVQRTQPFGGDYWVLGLELNEFLNNGSRCEYAALIPAAQKLFPDPPPRAPRQRTIVRRGS
jgi:hypothetical protein